MESESLWKNKKNCILFIHTQRINTECLELLPQHQEGTVFKNQIIHGNTYSHFQVRFGWGGKIKLNLLRKLGIPAALKAILTLLFPKGQTGWERSVLHPKEQSVVWYKELLSALQCQVASVKPLPASICSVQQELGISSFQLLQSSPSVLLNKDHFFKRR